jgi:hypothetical protein
MHLQKLWHKMTFNVITAKYVPSNLHKQPKQGSVTYLEYFGTYLEYLPTNPMSQHSDTFPAHPRHSMTLLIAGLVLFFLRNSWILLELVMHHNCTCLNLVKMSLLG